MLPSKLQILALATFVPAAILARTASVARAAEEPSSVYAASCASCHGKDGRAATPVGSALGIASFEGKHFTREAVEAFLRDSASHASLASQVSHAELGALVETLNQLAAGPEGEAGS